MGLSDPKQARYVYCRVGFIDSSSTRVDTSSLVGNNEKKQKILFVYLLKIDIIFSDLVKANKIPNQIKCDARTM